MKIKSFLPALALLTLLILPFRVVPSGAQEVQTADPALLDRGRALFHAKEGLGVKFACILCHKQEKAIKRSVVDKLTDADLAKVINQQLVKKAKGTKPIAADGADMQALITYIRQEHIQQG
jgi:cytochrome c